MAENESTQQRRAQHDEHDRPKANAGAAADKATTSIEHTVEKVQDQGFMGARTDPTPLEHYTVEGVTSNKPTPESDEKLADEARRNAVVR